jgi:DNA helicase HerA-like ATPase
MADYERLGAFYLGRPFDPRTGETQPSPLLYDARDLTTHAVCVGMTGSGKTGLCIGLLEEAAIDGVPAIAVDLKGDIANMFLTFPELRPADFAPWIDPADAARKGRTVEEHAAKTAALWRDGIGQWGQAPERIRRFEDAVERRLLTPGSTAGTPLALVRGLGAPAGERDPAVLAERADGASRALLALLGEDADDGPNRVQVFLANLLGHAYRTGQSFDLGGLVRAVLDPPIARVGVLDLDTFFGPKDREALALRLNALLGSPTFARWLAGEPLDAQRLFYAPDGRPRLSILSLAHLDERERIFVLTLLLTELIAWMRRQPGTGSLRAILYIDEVFGLLPPVREPATKRLLLTLLKQARAYGLGLVLATQNPVDLDYKALSNCGTWFLGRLQTQRDVDRVIDGLTGADGTLEPGALRATLAGLESRRFLMHNVHEDAPVLFQTRWVLSYLRGPMTERELSRLDLGEAPAAAPAAAAPAAAAPTLVAPAAATPPEATRPLVPTELIEERFAGEPVGDFTYVPTLWGEVELRYAHRASDLDETRTALFSAFLDEDTRAKGAWDDAERLAPPLPTLRERPEKAAAWGELPRGLLTKSGMRSVEAALKRRAAKEVLEVPRCKKLEMYGAPGEGLDTFTARIHQAAREERDRELAKVRERYAKQLQRAEAKVRSAEAKVATEKGQAQQGTLDTVLGVGTTLLGALFSRRATVAGHMGRAASAAKKAGRQRRLQNDVERAEARLADAEEALASLEEEAEEALDAIEVEIPAIDTVTVRPRKRDLVVKRVILAWEPE